MSERDDRKKKYKRDPRATEKLIDLALKEDDGHARGALIDILQYRGSYEVFEAARKLCESAVTKEKMLGADILASLGRPDRAFLEESLPILFNLLSKELEDEVLCSVVYALGRLGDEKIVEHLVKLKNHFNEHIRSRVVSGLSGQTKQEAIDALIELSKDEIEDIRSKATFEIAMLEVDTPDIREALFQRLNERGNWILDDIHESALYGLARRKDERVLEPLLKELHLLKEFEEDAIGWHLEDGSVIFLTFEVENFLILEAAKEFADQRLLPVLSKLQEQWGDDIEPLQEAIEACQSKPQ